MSRTTHVSPVSCLLGRIRSLTPSQDPLAVLDSQLERVERAKDTLAIRELFMYTLRQLVGAGFQGLLVGSFKIEFRQYITVIGLGLSFLASEELLLCPRDRPKAALGVLPSPQGQHASRCLEVH